MSTLGPQCLQCKKRRVKCDSTTPTCNKCEKDSYQCPGYTKGLTWVHVKPRPRPKLKKKFRVCRVPDGSSPSGSPGSTGGKLECVSRNQALTRLQVPNPGHVLITDLDRQTQTALEAVFFYNTEICRDLSAVHWLGKQTIDSRAWPHVPVAMQNMIIVSMLSTKAVRYGCNTAGPMYSYRGAVIRDVARHLKESPETEPPWMSLSLVLSMLSLEIYLSPIKDFKIHLDAARVAVTSHGGVAACMRLWPAAADVISGTEIISATTTSVDLLESQYISLQPDYLYALENFEDYLLDSCFPCPVTIFESIISISNLRLRSRTAQTSTSAWRQEIIHILEDIQSFNPWQWAIQLDHLPHDRPQSNRVHVTNEWATLASCYQSSTIIYLIESMRSQDILLATNMEQLGSAIANEAWRQLKHDLRYLHTAFPQRQASPDQPCLWRFCLWPLIVYTYGTIALPGLEAGNRGILGEEPRQRSIFDELREIGRSLASHSLIQGANLFEKLSKQDRPLKWDEVFPTSSVFYI